MELNFEGFYQWCSVHLKLNLSAYKEKQLQRRIATVMKQAGSTTLEEYALAIKENPTIKKTFLDYITINVTEFYRNRELFDDFEDLIVEYLAPKFGALNLWSAACSIGAEPYTMAMIADKNKLTLKRPILATDIDETILDRAKIATFKEHEIKNVSLVEKKSYFKEEEGLFYLDGRIKRDVRFKKHDLLLDPYEKGFHAIVCRNVTIYFKNEVKNELYHNLCESLVPGGLFFTGATETIYRPEEFGLRKVSSFIYEKL